MFIQSFQVKVLNYTPKNKYHLDYFGKQNYTLSNQLTWENANPCAKECEPYELNPQGFWIGYNTDCHSLHPVRAPINETDDLILLPLSYQKEGLYRNSHHTLCVSKKMSFYSFQSHENSNIHE